MKENKSKQNARKERDFVKELSEACGMTQEDFVAFFAPRLLGGAVGEQRA